MDKLAERILQGVARRGREAVARARARLRPGGAGFGPGDRLPITFAGSRSGEVEYGTTVLAAARTLKVDLDHFCGGNCSCGTCRVEIVRGAEHLSRLHMNEEITLGADAAARGHRLACQARVQGPVEVKIPEFFGVR